MNRRDSLRGPDGGRGTGDRGQRTGDRGQTNRRRERRRDRRRRINSAVVYTGGELCSVRRHVSRGTLRAAALLLVEVEVEAEAEVEVELEEAAGGAEVSEADEAAVVGRGEVGGGALLLRAVGVSVGMRVGVGEHVRVRVHGREAGAALHEAVEVEGDAVAGCGDLDAGDLVVVA